MVLIRTVLVRGYHFILTFKKTFRKHTLGEGNTNSDSYNFDLTSHHKFRNSFKILFSKICILKKGDREKIKNG